MQCLEWRQGLDTFLDGESSQSQDSALQVHLRGCPDCAAELVTRLQLKRLTKAAGKRYVASEQLRKKIARQAETVRWGWGRLVLATAAAVAIAVFALSVWTARGQQRQIMAQLVDIHVATLASANPVDVISTDRHTVKPWFQGKVPFSFDVPDLAGTNVELLGGRVVFLGQHPVAQLLYKVREHRISVFIAQADTAGIASSGGLSRDLNFHGESWTAHGLSYCMISDASPYELTPLVARLKTE
jgi:anti-sigma factor RsiW